MKSVLLLLLVLLPLYSNAKEVSGTVIDEDGRPLFAAYLFFTSQPDKVALTDLNGNFAIKFTNESDTLNISFIGYSDVDILASSLLDSTIIVLKRSSLKLDEVIVSGSTPVSKQFSTEKMSSMDIYLNPISQADPLKAISNLVSSTNNDETANPSLRGSSSDRTRVIYNGVPIYNPVRASNLNNVGFFSLFNTEMIDNQYVYPSNPPLIYGNASGGIVDIATIRRLQENKLQLSLGLGNIGFLASQKIKDKESFFQVYGNYQFSDFLKGLNDKSLPDLKKYVTRDAGGNLRLKIRKNVYFNSYNYFIKESYQGISHNLSYQGEFGSESRRFFTVNNLDVFTPIGLFSLNYGFDYDDKYTLFGNNKIDSESYSHFASLNYKQEILPDFTLQTGVSIDNKKSLITNDLPKYYYAMDINSPTYKVDTTILNQITEPYLYMNWDLNNKVSMSAGGRTNIPRGNQKQYTSYQYSLNYSPKRDHTLIFSTGRYHNYTQPDSFNVEYSLLSSRQISLDYIYENKNSRIQAAVYFKKEDGQRPMGFYYNIGETNIYGMEFSINQNIGKYLKLTFANSIVNQSIEVDGDKFKGGYNYLYFLKPSISYSNPNLFTIGISYTARPGSYILHYPVASSVWNNSAGSYQPIYSELTQEQRAPYNRVDLSASKYIRLNKFAFTLYLTINNLLDIENQTNDIYYNSDFSQTYDKYYTLRMFYFGVIFTIF